MTTEPRAVREILSLPFVTRKIPGERRETFGHQVAKEGDARNRAHLLTIAALAGEGRWVGKGVWEAPERVLKQRADLLRRAGITTREVRKTNSGLTARFKVDIGHRAKEALRSYTLNGA